MPAELFFKVAFGCLFLAATSIAARTAKRAARAHGGSMNQLQYEARGLVWLRAALGLVFYASLFTWLFATHRFRWAYLPLPLAIRTTAAILIVPSLLWFRAAFQALDTNYRGGVGLYEDHQLVTTGPYRMVRHPIYVAFIVMMALLFVMSANWMLGASGILLVTLIAVIRIPIEERELAERFGDAWDAYCHRIQATRSR